MAILGAISDLNTPQSQFLCQGWNQRVKNIFSQAIHG
jgi:hypothetical protein